MTNPIPLNAPVPGQIELTARRLSVVTVRGVSYEFSITGSISDRRCDELVKNHIEFLLTASKRDSFDKINSVIKKTDSTLDSSERFKVESSHVEYRSRKGKIKNVDAWDKYVKPMREKTGDHSQATIQKASRFWQATQDSLVELTSGAANPAETPTTPIPTSLDSEDPAPQNIDPVNSTAPSAPSLEGPEDHSAPSPANPPLVERPRTITTPYVNRAKRMQIDPRTPPNQLQVDYALATQLSKMPNTNGGVSQYNGQYPLHIKKDLRNKYVKHINDHKSDYLKEPKFTEIFDNLKNALLKDNQNLKNACNKLHSPNWQFFGYTNINESQLRALLTNPVGVLTSDQKNGLINIHNEYVKDGLYLNESSFLDAFVKIHNPESSPDMFEVVVINPANPEKAYLCANNPSSANNLPISEESCAFLYVDSQGRYQSISREKTTLPLGLSLTNPSIPGDGNDNRDVSNELQTLIDLYDTYDDNSIKNYIFGIDSYAHAANLHNNYPQAFERLKYFIYRHDSESNNVNANIASGLNNPDYGLEALKAMTADVLANFLMTNRAKILAVGQNKHAVI